MCVLHCLCLDILVDIFQRLLYNTHIAANKQNKMKIRYLDHTADGKPMWVYRESAELPKVGDTIGFTCNGRGRGGHFHVTARITKVNAKTLKATEALNSYSPGTPWKVSKDIPELYIYKDFM